jgi:hypothetical protein
LGLSGTPGFPDLAIFKTSVDNQPSKW